MCNTGPSDVPNRWCRVVGRRSRWSPVITRSAVVQLDRLLAFPEAVNRHGNFGYRRSLPHVAPMSSTYSSTLSAASNSFTDKISLDFDNDRVPCCISSKQGLSKSEQVTSYNATRSGFFFFFFRNCTIHVVQTFYAEYIYKPVTWGLTRKSM